MSQGDYVVASAPRAEALADINAQFAATVTHNTGSSEPSTTYAHMIWADSTADPAVFKVRNTDNDTWVSIFDSDGTITGSGGIGGSGTVGTIPVFVTDTTTIGNSIMTEASSDIGINGELHIGVSSPSAQATLHVEKSSAGSFTPGFGTNTLIVEDTNNPGMSFIGDDTSNMRIALGGISDVNEVQLTWGTSANDIILTWATATPTTALRFDNTGSGRLGVFNAGIPDAKVHIKTDDNALYACHIENEHASNGYGLRITAGSTNTYIILGEDNAGTNKFYLNASGTIQLAEVASANTDDAGFGQIWVKNTTPCELWFTDDAGTDTQIV